MNKKNNAKNQRYFYFQRLDTDITNERQLVVSGNKSNPRVSNTQCFCVISSAARSSD